MMIGAGKGSPLYLSDGKSMTVWNLPDTAAGPSSTSMSSQFCATAGELLWPLLRACASCRVSSCVTVGDSHADLDPDRELCPARENHR